MTLASLKQSGTIPLDREKLKIISRGVDIIPLIFFRVFVGILKGPVPLVELSLLISSSISLPVVDLGHSYCYFVLYSTFISGTCFVEKVMSLLF